MPIVLRTTLYALPLLLAGAAFAHETGEPHAHTELLPLISRWVHILSAIFMLGGAFFIRFVLMPVAGVVLDETTHTHLQQAVRNRWKRFVHVFILLFILSGLYNYMVNMGRFPEGEAGPYHMMFGIKFLLAIIVFLLASLLVGKTSLALKLQANGRLWAGITVLLAVIVSMIGGYMKFM